MAFKDYTSIVENAKKKKKDNEKNKSSNIKDYSTIVKKGKLGNIIGFDTLESDLASVGKTIGSVYGGWQSQDTMNKTKTEVESMYNRLTALQEYNKINGNMNTDSIKSLDEAVNEYKGVLDNWDELSYLYKGYKSAEDYTKQLGINEKAAQEEQEMKSVNLDDVQKEIDDLNTQLENHRKKIGSNSVKEFLVGFADDYNSLSEEESPYDEITDLKKQISEKTAYLNRAEWLQKGVKLSGVLDENSEYYDKDFSKYIKSGSKVNTEEIGDTDLKSPGKGRTVRVDDKYKQFSKVLEAYRNSNDDTEFENPNSSVYNYMTPEEFERATYFIGKDIEEGSDLKEGGKYLKEYLYTIEEDLNARAASKKAEKIKGKPMLEVLQGADIGINQFFEGATNLFNTTDEYIPYSTSQQLNSMIKEDMKRNGKVWDVAYDVTTTTANMVPSILASTVSNALIPGSGAVVGSVLMGSSAAGNSYQEKLNLGWSEADARQYSTIVGVSEAGLQYALGGVSKLGGKLTSNSIKAIANGIDNAAARFVLQYGANMASEGLEESLQEVLNPFFENLTLGYAKNDFSDIELGKVAYSGMLGALSAGLLENVSTVNDTFVANSKYKKVGATSRLNKGVSDILDMAALSKEETETYNLYSQYAKKGVNADNVSDLQLGRLHHTLEADNKNIISSKKTTGEQKTDALITLGRLSTIGTESEARKLSKELTKNGVAEDNAVTSSGEKIDISGIKLGEDTKIVTSDGREISLSEITPTQKDADLLGCARLMSENDANLFIEQYDGETDAYDYADSFNLVMDYAKHNFTQDYILEHKGVLSNEQVNAIYGATVINQYKAKQNAIDKLNAKYGKSFTIQGTIDDSVIDYDNTGAEGKVAWNSLKNSQRIAITFMKGIAKGTGMNLKLIPNGLELGINGVFDIKENTIVLDIYAGMDKIDAADLSEIIIPAASHEMTHWMKEKSPELYRKVDEKIFSILEEADGISEEERVNDELSRLQKKHPDSNHTKEDARDEIIARACEDMLAMSEEGKKIFDSLNETEKKTFVDKIKDIIETFKKWVNDLLSHYKSKSYEAEKLRKYQDRLSEISKMWDEMWRQSIQANQSLQKEGITGEKLAKSVNKKTSTENGEVKNSDRYWYPNMSKSEMNYVRRIAKYELLTSDNYIDNDNKWLYNDKKGNTYFALYSTADANEPTILYACKGQRALNEYQLLSDIFEKGANENENINTGTGIIDRILVYCQNAKNNGSVNSRNALGGRSNNGNATVHSKDSRIRPSEALLNCLRNIREIQERNQSRKYSDRKKIEDKIQSPAKSKSLAARGVSPSNDIVRQNSIKSQEKFSDRDLSDYSHITEMQTQLNEIRATIREIEASEEFKAEMNKLSKAVDEDNAVDGVKAYQQWKNTSGYGELVETRDSLQVEIEKLQKEFTENSKKKAITKEQEAIKKSGLNEADYFRKQAVKEFGYTPYFYDAGYIVANGKMLNFSGEKGQHYGSRGQDHRAIGMIYADTSGTDALKRFMKDGNIRIMPESPSLDISSLVKPTKEQYSTIRKFVYEYSNKEYFSIDFSDENGYVVGTLEYENNINPTRIINDIKHFFATGEIREQSSINKFRYSDRNNQYIDIDSEDNKLTTEQQEFFKDSQNRDETGRLKVMYHGTPETFTVFDRKKSSPFNLYGRGFYFTDSKSHADQYGNVTKEYYLNIKNPISTYKDDNIITKKQLRKYLEVVAKNEDYSIENYGTYDIDTILNSVYSKNKSDYAMIQDINATAIGDLVEAIELFNEVNGTIFDGLILATETIIFNSNQAKLTSNKKPTADSDVRFSDRDNVSVYEAMGEIDSLKKENEKFKEDVERLKERLKLERQITHGNHFNENQLDAVAAHIRNIANSNYSKADLVNLLKGLYSYIATSKDLNWQDVYSQAYDIARMVLEEVKPITETNEYYKSVLSDIRNSRISVNELQIQEAKFRLGLGNKWRNAFFNRIKISNDAISLDRQWQEWSAEYPDLFDADISDADMLVELYDIYDSLKAGSEIVVEYDMEEQARWLAREIYNQYWNVSPIRTTAEKYDKQIKLLNYKHREAMSQLRTGYKDRLKTQHKVDREKATQLIKQIRERKDKEIAGIKQRSKERMDAYKDNAARKTKIQSITAKALTLNEWLVKNSKEKHIHESLKGPVANLLQAIDFSSKQLLGMRGGEFNGTPTRKDISLQKALSQVKDMMLEASVGKEELVDLYGHDLDEDIKLLVESVDGIMRNVGDNEFILNKMTLTDLNTLDNMLKTIKQAVTKMNQFHIVHHAQGISSLAKETIRYTEKLGNEKIYTEGSLKSGTKKMLKWTNSVPYYTFKRFGEAGKKVFEAFQDGWDKLSFNVKEVIDFTHNTYSSKEVKAWEKEIKSFDVLVPATDTEKSDPNYKSKSQKVQMTTAQVMYLYLLNKRASAKAHLLGGGIVVSNIEAKKGQLISQPDGAILEQGEIDKIIKTLTPRQIEVADALSKFMNTVCSDWGNEVSMARFGYKAFGEPNYVPMQVDKDEISTADPAEKNNSLFKLLNMSFTKSLTEGANNRLVISSIFDVFAQHTSDMAKYNALALPVLDAFKWYNYKEIEYVGEEAKVRNTVKKSIKKAFGQDGQSYITTLLEDINGQNSMSRDKMSVRFFKNSKLASVGMNLRVILLQPTSYFRASANIDNKYLIKALAHKPKIAYSEKYCGIALWKSLGYYDTNIQRGVAEQIKHAEKPFDKMIEFSMKGAGEADRLTLGYLWNAAELETRKLRKDLKVGSEEFFLEVGKRLRDIIYSTQVVDSTLTRSEFMRSPDGRDKILSMFASEPTLAYNILQDACIQTSLDARELGSKKAAFKKNGKKIARAITAYTITNAVAAIVESCFDFLRDDDDDFNELDMAEFMKLYLSNFAADMSIVGKIPYLKEVLSILQGYSPSRSDVQWMQSAYYALKGVSKHLQGEGNPITTIKNSIKTFSYLSGLPFYNAYRDIMATLDEFEVLTADELEEICKDLFGIE